MLSNEISLPPRSIVVSDHATHPHSILFWSEVAVFIFVIFLFFMQNFQSTVWKYALWQLHTHLWAKQIFTESILTTVKICHGNLKCAFHSYLYDENWK